MSERKRSLSKGETNEGGEEENVSQEKLIHKCQTLMKIAHKEKQSRKEAVEKLEEMKDENAKLNDRVTKLSKDYSTAEEMLATLTEQKLKLSMQMDDLKKEKKKFTQELQNLSSNQERMEAENLSYKRQYTRITSENDRLLSMLDETETKLKNALAVQADIQKLRENNESVKLLCTNVTQEKQEIKKECQTLNEKVFILEKEKDMWMDFLKNKFDCPDSDINKWIETIGTYMDTNKHSIQGNSQKENENSALKDELKALKISLSCLSSEKDSVKQELEKALDQINALNSELESIHADRDKLVSNLENMRFETRQLIENSDKLSEDMEVLKCEKNRLDNELSAALEENNDLRKELLAKENDHSNLPSNDKIISELEESQNKIIHLEDQNKRLLNELEELKNSSLVQVKELEQFKKQFQNIQKLQQTLESDFLKTKEELNSALKMLHASQERENALLKDVEQLRQVQADFDALQDNFKKSLLEWETTKSKLESSISDKAEIVEKDYSEIKNLLESTKRENSELNDLIEAARSEKLQLNNLYETAKEENSKLNGLLESTKTENSELLNVIESVKKENSNQIILLESSKEKLSELNDQFQSVKRENLEFNDLYESAKKENSELSTLCKSAEEENSLLSREISTLKEQLHELGEQTNLLKEQLLKSEEQLSLSKTSFKNSLLEKSQLLEVKEKELTQFRNELSDMKDKNKVLSEKFTELERDLNGFRINDETLRSREEMDSKEMDSLRELLLQKDSDMENLRRTWLGNMTALKGAFVGLKHSKEEMRKEMTAFITSSSSSYKEFYDRISSCIEKTMSSSKHDLLGEMQHMNQALKERGEIISQLQQSIEESSQRLVLAEEKFAALEKEVSVKNSLLEEREKDLKLKENVIKELELEISRAKESLDSSAVSDVMSTSTISRADETMRMKDVEDSLEEKYNRLKMLAVKLKKKCSELAASLEHERSTHEKERSEFAEKIQNLNHVTRNAQKLQESYDALMDSFEEEKKKNKSLETSIQNNLKTENTLKEQINLLERDTQKLTNLEKYIETLDASLKASKAEIVSLSKEKEVEVIKYGELKKEHTKLEVKLSEVSSSLEEALQQNRSSNLLELEMTNCERTIEELSTQLNSEKERVKGLNEELEAVSNIKNGLEAQITLLESQVKIEEERNLSTNDQLSSYKSQYEELHSLVNEKVSEVERLESELQTERRQNETLTVEAAKLSSEFGLKEKEMDSQLSALHRRVSSLESLVRSREEELEVREGEVERVRSEFESYRVRAQGVLARLKGEGVSQGERDAVQQVQTLTQEKETLTRKLQSLLSEIDLMKADVTAHSHEKDRALRRVEDLTKLLNEKTRESDKVSSEFRTFKISTQTLRQCFKTEMEERELQWEERERGWREEVEELRARLEALEGRCHSPETSPLHPDPLEPLPQLREDAEGSESVPSPVLRKKSQLVPLDVLLNTPDDSEAKMLALVERVERLEKEAIDHEVRSRHLAGLLSEAERDSARNLHLNSVLKEELRRLERSIERQPHVANTEYLKNVIFKFITLQCGDERSRLIPVLGTMLKLSPEEISKVTAVAKGEAGTGWGSYLSSWTGI